MEGETLYLILVAFLWGFTNPMIKQGGAGIENIKKRNALLQFFAEVQFLVSNWKYMVPFLINQSGSIIYFLCLASVNLSMAVPITNALTFIFTIVAGKVILEEKISTETLVGMLLVLGGVTLCACGNVAASS
ncbi:transmembrane protein 234-like [Lineus longissimus]|uniref:transmembrane protein 234-like n=1 Tax=Lineus longissimus TaxID=88925 RepID=UPI00315D7B88